MESAQEQLYDIYLQWHVPFWQTSFFFYTILIIGILFIATLIGMLVRYYMQKKYTDSYVSVAQKSLDQLQKSTLYTPDQASAFYAALVMILKKYITAHYGIDCVSATDQECLTIVRIHVHNDALHDLLQQILEGTLLVRFAQGDRLLRMMQEDMQKAYDLITLTQPAKI